MRRFTRTVAWSAATRTRPNTVRAAAVAAVAVSARRLSTGATVASASASRPFRVAVIGSGPAGFYTTKYLLKELEAAAVPIKLDMYDALPTPFGLVRFGVAPDHPEVKSVQNDFTAVTQNAAYRFIGNIKVGTDITLDDLKKHYSAIVLAYGAVSDRELGLPNEKLSGVHAARHFVNWYNAHPNFANAKFDLESHDTAVVIGQGNVAIDVARILTSPIDALAKTDIADYALEALSKSRIRRVFVMGRRGPVQTAFTIKELREVTQLPGTRAIIEAADMQSGLNAASLAEVIEQRALKRKVELLEKVAADSAATPVLPSDKELRFGFFRSPSALHASAADPTRIGAVSFERTRLDGPAGAQVAVGTGVTERIECGLVLRSIGYKSTALPGVAFDSRRNVVPSAEGRVHTESGAVDRGLYVSGWLKRGPTGIIATNIVDAKETVKSIVEDVRSGALPATPIASASASASNGDSSSSSIDELLKSRGLAFVDTEGWRRIEAAENAAGQSKGKPREKLVDVSKMLAVAKHT